jgi:hypothetical protein
VYCVVLLPRLQRRSTARAATVDLFRALQQHGANIKERKEGPLSNEDESDGGVRCAVTLWL